MGDRALRCRPDGRRGPVMLMTLLIAILAPGGSTAASPAPAPSPTVCVVPGADGHRASWDAAVYGTVEGVEPLADVPGAAWVTVAVRHSLGTVDLAEAHFRAGPGGCLPLDPARFAVGDELVVAAFDHPSTDPDLAGDLLVWMRDGDRWLPDAYAAGIDARLPPEVRTIRAWWEILDLLGGWMRPPPDPAPTPPASLRPVRLTVPLAVTSGSLECHSIGGCAYVLQVQGDGLAPVTVQLEQDADGSLAAPGGALQVAPGPATATLDVWAVSDVVRDGTRAFGAILATCAASLEVPISSERLGLTLSSTADTCTIEVRPAAASATAAP